MKMMKQFKIDENHATARKVVYENTHFRNGYAQFLEAVVLDQLIINPSCSTIVGGYCWADNVGSGGIRLETTKHPYIQNKEAGSVSVVGSKQSLEMFQSIMERHRVSYDGSPTTSDIHYKIEYHDKLNPQLWEESDGEESLQPDVKEALENLAQAFYDFLDMPNLSIEDVVLTGSSANFNWTSSSDIDLHFIVDMGEVESEFGNLAINYFDAKKKIWNDLHDIKIKGIPTEVYVQDKAEVHNSTGIYSIYDQEWVVKPKHSPPSVDDAAVKAKASEWVDTIKDLMNSNKASVVEAFMKKLSKLRQAGLDEGGEFSAENVAFKILRNDGWLDKLVDLKTKIYDRELSVEEEEYSWLWKG